MIITESINNRTDWYHARATVGNQHYFTFEKTRDAAFLGVLRQLIVAGHVRGVTL